jgi:hypothetical protein
MPAPRLRFLSVSDRYVSGALDGHPWSYQEALAAAAGRAGHTFTMAAPAERVAADDALVTLRLLRRDWPTIAREVAAHLRGAAPHVVLVYEGSVEALAAFAEVAPTLDGHTVVLNLFGPGWPLDVPRDGERRGVDVRTDPARRAAALAALAAPLPPNVVVLADTERRAFLARARGLDVAGVWPTYSILAAPEADLRAADAADAPDATTPDPAHVVIALPFRCSTMKKAPPAMKTGMRAASPGRSSGPARLTINPKYTITGIMPTMKPKVTGPSVSMMKGIFPPTK